MVRNFHTPGKWEKGIVITMHAVADLWTIKCKWVITFGIDMRIKYDLTKVDSQNLHKRIPV